MEPAQLEIARARLRALERKRHRLRETLAQLGHEEAELRQFLDTRERLSRQKEVAPPKPDSPPPGPLDEGDVSLRKAVVIALRAADEPLKSREIAEKLLELEFPYKKGLDSLDAAIRTVLVRNMEEEGGPFRRFQRGVYGLREWGAGRFLRYELERRKASDSAATESEASTEQEGAQD